MIQHPIMIRIEHENKNLRIAILQKARANKQEHEWINTDGLSSVSMIPKNRYKNSS